jgi:hypothetical protein
VQTPRHDSRDRIRIAEVSGALSNLAGKVRRGELAQDQAVAELHDITRDPHLLAHGLGVPGKWGTESVVLQLALAAGVDLDEAQRIHDEMHPPRGQRNIADLSGPGHAL